MTRNEYLELADWRRGMAALFAEWRDAAGRDPVAATHAFRAARDRLFAEHPQSPLPAEERAAFGGLEYWPYDGAYRMAVRVVAGDDAEPHARPSREAGAAPADAAGPTLVNAAGSFDLGAIALPSSGPEPFAFRRIGRVELAGPLAGHALSVFWIEGYGGGLFLPFRDATSGRETYGAGRYALDTIKSADHGGDAEAGTLVVDFNMAYHPSCAYDPRWACPLAPPENTLRVPVPVGERLVASGR